MTGDRRRLDPLPDRPSRRAWRRRARHSGGGRAAPRVSVGAHRLARQRASIARSWISSRPSIAGWSINDRGGAGGGASSSAAIRELRRGPLRRRDRSARADQIRDPRAAVRRAARDRLFVALRCANGWRGCSTPTCTIRAAAACTIRRDAHVVRMNLGMLDAARDPRRRTGIPDRTRRSRDVARGDARRGGRPLRAAQSRRRVAEQALAARALGAPSRWRCASGTASAIGCPLGARRRILAAEVVAAAAGAAILSPKTSIADLVALARGAAVMVSGDTGPTHIAAAVGTPIVGIYGPTRPSRNGPWPPDDVTVSRDAICQCHHLRRCRLTDVPARHRGRRGASPRSSAVWLERGVSEPWLDRQAGTGAARRAPAGGARVRVRRRWCSGWRRRRGATIAAGMAMAVAGEALRVWAAGHLNKSREVTASGPYRLVGASALCRVVDHGRRPRGRVRTASSSRSSSRLSGVDGDGGDQAARRRFCAGRSASSTTGIASGGARRQTPRTRFSLAQAMANREHRAVAGLGGAVLLLVLKATYNGSFWRTAGARHQAGG